MYFCSKKNIIMDKIIVQGIPISVVTQDSEDYICLTDMLQAKDGDFFIADWLRNRNTLEYIGIWEKISNPNFNYGEFATIRNQAGLNRFKISVKEFVARTNAVCLHSKAGRYGGTYAHKEFHVAPCRAVTLWQPCVKPIAAAVIRQPYMMPPISAEKPVPPHERRKPRLPR